MVYVRCRLRYVQEKHLLVKPARMPEGSEAGQVLKEVLPRKGLLYQEDSSPLALCRPKLMPLKSVTLEKLEAMQKAAQEKGRQQQEEQLERQATAPAGGSRIF
ncbi:BBSome-interacting protein 1-like isoform X1 [Penaeus chinensis]|uniref:BBSome-interacting protein 1-like isoform X1 n=2 Tax=Penaeus TaxID=133894 RepID=UPI001FB6E4C2|nr:BBSome-interacting protein 1-like isoform X1 [Penaeus chinensis]